MRSVALTVVALLLLPSSYVGRAFQARRDGGPERAALRVKSEDDAAQQLATIKQYCAGCHNDRVKIAGVSFDGLTPEGIGQHADMFEKAVRKLRGRVMPPPGARQPDAATIESLLSWLENSLDHAGGPLHLP